MPCFCQDEAISYKLGAEAVSGSCNNDNNDSNINIAKNTNKDVARVVISRDTLETTKSPAAIRLVPEKTSLKADGHDVLAYHLSKTYDKIEKT